MCDAEYGTVFTQPVDGRLDLGLGLGIERGGGFVKHEDRRITYKRPRDGQALSLATGERDAALADACVVPPRQCGDELMRVRMLCCLLDLPLGAARLAKRNVFRHGQVEQHHLLADQCHLRAKPLDAQASQIMPVELHGARVGVVKPKQQIDERAFAGTALADNAQLGSDGDVQVESSQHRFVLVRERDIVELDAPLETGHRSGSGALEDVRLFVEDIHQALGTNAGFLNADVQASQLPDGRIKHNDTGEKNDQVRHAASRVNDIQDQCADADHRHRFDQRADDFPRAHGLHRLSDQLLGQLPETVHAGILQPKRLNDAHAGKHLHREARLVDVCGDSFACCLAGFFAEVNDRDDADGKQYQHSKGQLPVDQAEAGENTDDSHRFRHEVAHTGGQAGLQQLRVAVDARDEVAGGGAVEEGNGQAA